MKKARNGFTLIELLAALAILGLIFGVTTLKFDVLFARSRIEASARGVGDHFSYAVNRACTTGSYHTLVFDLENCSYWIQPGREDDSSGTVLLKRRLEKGIAFEDIQVGYDRYEAPGTLAIEVSPLGVTNDVIVNLTDEESQAYAVSLDALTQRVTCEDGHRDYEEAQDAPMF